MRKLDPNNVRKDFLADVNGLLEHMKRIAVALQGSQHEKKDISRLATTTFLTAYVDFERFLSDLFLAYLNRRFSQYQTHLAQRLDQSVKEKFGDWVGTRVRFDRVDHVKVADLEQIVDPDGWNLTFPSAHDIKQRARDWLVPAHSARFQAMTVHDERLIDTARAIRDFIAHQSPASKKRMNEYLKTVAQGGHNLNLGRGVHQVHAIGSFLKTVCDGQRRVALYLERLKAVAVAL